MTSQSHPAFSMHAEGTERRNTLDFVMANESLLGRTSILSARQDSAQSVTIHASHTLAVFGERCRFQSQYGNGKEGKKQGWNMQ